jgi:hypothetical protein
MGIDPHAINLASGTNLGNAPSVARRAQTKDGLRQPTRSGFDVITAANNP